MLSAPELLPFDAASHKDMISHDQIMDLFRSHAGEQKSQDVKVVNSETVFRMRYRLSSYVEKRTLRKEEHAVIGHHHGMAIRAVQPIA